MQNFNLLSDRLKWAISQKEAMSNHKITQTDIANLFKPVPLSRAAVSNWMQDKNKMDAKYARVIAKYLGVNELWLEENIGVPKPATHSPLKQNTENYIGKLKQSNPLDELVSQLTKVFVTIPQQDREILLLMANRLYSLNFPDDGIASGRKSKTKAKNE